MILMIAHVTHVVLPYPFISYQYHSFLENSELRQIGIFSLMHSVLQSCTARIKVNKRNPNQLVADGTGVLDSEKQSEILLLLKAQSVKRQKKKQV